MKKFMTALPVAVAIVMCALGTSSAYAAVASTGHAEVGRKTTQGQQARATSSVGAKTRFATGFPDPPVVNPPVVNPPVVNPPVVNPPVVNPPVVEPPVVPPVEPPVVNPPPQPVVGNPFECYTLCKDAITEKNAALRAVLIAACAAMCTYYG